MNEAVTENATAFFVVIFDGFSGFLAISLNRGLNQLNNCK